MRGHELGAHPSRPEHAPVTRRTREPLAGIGPGAAHNSDSVRDLAFGLNCGHESSKRGGTRLRGAIESRGHAGLPRGACLSILEDAGYSTERDSSELRYSSTDRRIWLIVLIVLLFPISLLLLLAVMLLASAGRYRGQLFSKTDQLTIKVSPLDPGSRVTVVGTMPSDPQGQLTELLEGIGKRRASAGWYEEAAGIERYWDGEDWTEQIGGAIDRPIVVDPRMQHGAGDRTAADQAVAGRSASRRFRKIKSG